MDDDVVSCCGCLLVFVLAFALLIVPSTYLGYGNPDVITGEVLEKYVKSGGHVFYVVLDTEEGKQVVSNVDMFWCGKFNSADIQADLEIGRSYDFEVRGFRIQFLSRFKNIVRVR